MIVGLGCEEEGAKNSAPAKEPTKTEQTPEKKAEPEVSKITWKEIDSVYNLKSKFTDAQKEEKWKEYEGKIIEWTGEVSDISEGWTSGYNLLIKMNQSTLTHDLQIGLDDSQKEKVLKVSKGDKIKFRGKLNEWGSLLAISLSDGEILD